ncbi:MAG: SRPBCC family protein [Actinomycetota bacterium]|nr:SRPBCC family protein [Actinomycetota bacterium]
MLEVQRSTTVRRQLADVVDYLSDFANTELWDAGTKSCHRIDSGPVQPGARWENVSEFRGKETTIEYTLIRQEPTRLTFTGANKTVSTVDDLSFEPDGSQTRIRYTARFTFHGLAKLAQPFVKASLDKLADDTIAQLTRVIDEQAV